MLISCADTAQLNCTNAFAYARSRFSHDGAQISLSFCVLNRTFDDFAAFIVYYLSCVM